MTELEVLDIREGAAEVRVEIRGPLCGSSVEDLRHCWSCSMSRVFWRRFVVDISGMTDYDEAGRLLLHRIWKFGAVFGARTPNALHFLEEISSTPQNTGVRQIPRREMDRELSGRPARPVYGSAIVARAMAS